VSGPRASEAANAGLGFPPPLQREAAVMERGRICGLLIEAFTHTHKHTQTHTHTHTHTHTQTHTCTYTRHLPFCLRHLGFERVQLQHVKHRLLYNQRSRPLVVRRENPCYQVTLMSSVSITLRVLRDIFRVENIKRNTPHEGGFTRSRQQTQRDHTLHLIV